MAHNSDNSLSSVSMIKYPILPKRWGIILFRVFNHVG